MVLFLRSGLTLGPIYSDLSRLLTDLLFEAREEK